MAKGKRKTSLLQETEHELGQTNLAFEPCEPTTATGDIVKSRSKEDISTLNKNLDDSKDEKKLKVTKKKKFKSSERIENDLFESGNDEKTKKRTKKTSSAGRKSNKKLTEQPDPESIELAPLNNQGAVHAEYENCHFVLLTY